MNKTIRNGRQEEAANGPPATRRQVLAAVALGAVLPASGADAPPLLARAAQASYARPMRLLRESERDGAPTAGVAQELAVQLARRGEHDAAIARFDAILPPEAARPAPDLGQDRAEDAVAAIVREAAGHRIVILNEAHHVSLHRAFAMRLARELRKIGFDCLACEAFGIDAQPGAALLTHTHGGNYLRDPVFAEFIRDAQRDGWALAGYDSNPPWDARLTFAERQGRRETGQARNLVDRVLARGANTRAFVYAGYGHGGKKPFSFGAMPMGAELQRLSGLAVLSIDQVATYAHPDARYEATGYRAALARTPLRMPFVLRQPDGACRVLQSEPGNYDMQVIHAPSPPVQGRSGWLQALAGREPHPIPAAWMPAHGRRLIYAVHEGDPPDALPADLVQLNAGNAAPALMLPPGRFRFEFEDE